MTATYTAGYSVPATLSNAGVVTTSFGGGKNLLTGVVLSVLRRDGTRLAGSLCEQVEG